MCQIYAFDPAHVATVLPAATAGTIGNRDGANFLLVDEDRVVLSVSGLWMAGVLSILETMPAGTWTRAFLHLRAATGSSRVTTGNCHGWADRDDGTRYVMHNGVISRTSREAAAVDSQGILQWIESGGTALALRRLRDETFANVFIIDESSGEYYIHRSSTGFLYTDGAGNYGTGTYGDVTLSVPDHTQNTHDIETGETLSSKKVETRFAYQERTRGSRRKKYGTGAYDGGHTAARWWEQDRYDYLATSAADGPKEPAHLPATSSRDTVRHRGTDGILYADDAIDGNRFRRWRAEPSGPSGPSGGWTYVGIIDKDGNVQDGAAHTITAHVIHTGGGDPS